MLGAIEVGLIIKLAREHGETWREAHRGVLSCLLAHHNRRTDESKPTRKILAEYTGVSTDTVDRILADFRDWGLVRWKRGGVRRRGLKVANQYEFLFSIPDLPSAAKPPLPSAAKPPLPSAAKPPLPSAAACCGTKPLEALNLKALPSDSFFENEPQKKPIQREEIVCSRHPDSGRTNRGACWACYMEANAIEQVCPRHPDSGRTPRGNCWACYMEDYAAAG